jgi:hypothetical protein
MKLPIRLVVAVLAVVSSAFSGTPTTFCDLLRNAEKYNEKEVTVRATWNRGYESSDFYCLDCSDKGSVWLDFGVELDDASKKAIRQIPRYGTANLTVQGVFMSGGLYGYKNHYHDQLVAKRVSNVAIVWSGTPFTAAEKEAVKQCGCGGMNPK